MNHNDATDKDLPSDPDATEAVQVDLEALLHKELDEARNARTVAAMKAARPFLRPSQRISTAKISNSRIPPMPIHSLPPPMSELDELLEDDDATCVFDRASAPKYSLPKVSTPSIKSIQFRAPSFSPPVRPQPFATIPAMPVAKRKTLTADASQGITPIQPVQLPPTSRRELQQPLPKAADSVPPVSMPSSYPSSRPSAPPQASSRASMVAAGLSVAFAAAAMLVIGVGVFKPALVERGKVAVTTAMRPKRAPTLPVSTITAAEQPGRISVPPILIDDEPDVTIGDTQTYLVFPESAKGHRVFVDGRAIGDGDVPALVDCGKHKVQIGSSGNARQMDLACGGGYRLSE